MLERLAELALPGGGGALALRRAWPRSSGHLLLEYVDETGGLVPGQWMRSLRRLARVAGETGASGGCGVPVKIVELDDGGVLLQPGGADRRLPGLRGVLARPGASLVSHRPERRAVVEMSGAGGRCFAKVVRPERLGDVVAPARALAALEGRPFALPDIVEVDEAGGVVTFSALGGACLHDMSAGIVEAMEAAGAALRWLHDAPRPERGPAARTHDAPAETAVIEKWVQSLWEFIPAHAGAAREKAEEVSAALAGEPSPDAILHRDFYDKQVFVQDDRRVGLLDFDTLALGEAALDVGNMVAHIELRGLQGAGDQRSCSEAAVGFLEGYDPPPDVWRRLPAYMDATRLRLACLYAFRPRWAHLTPQLLDRVGAASK